MKHRTFRGALSLGGATMVLRVVSIASTVVLARLLDPADFGVVALAYVVLHVVVLLSKLGLGAALIQRPGDIEQTAFQSFVVTTASGLLFWLTIALGADLLGEILGNTDVVAILPWMGSIVFLGAISRTPEALLEKSMRFGTLSLIMILTEVVYIVLAIGMAFSGWGMWSLVYATVVKSIMGAILAWVLSTERSWIRPRPWDRQLMRELLRFGIKMVASSSVYTFYSNFDNFIVGREIGAVALGFYSKAYDFTTKTVDSMNKTIGIVLFPSYARLQEDRARLSNAYLKSLRIISCLTVPASMGIFITAPELVPVVLGEKWLPIVPILQVLAFMSLVKPLSSTTSAVFNSTGNPGLNFRAGVMVTVFMAGLIVLLLPMGTVGVALAVFGSHVIGLTYNIYQIHRLLPGTALRMLPAVTPSVLATAVMVGLIYVLKEPLRTLAGGTHSPWTLLAMTGAGAAAYTAGLFLIQRPLLQEIIALLRRRTERTES